MALYILYNIVFTPAFYFQPSLYMKGPFIKGSYCKSSQSRAVIGSGPLLFFPDVLPNIGIEMADTSYRNSISARKNTKHTAILNREIKKQQKKKREKTANERERGSVQQQTCLFSFFFFFGLETERETPWGESQQADRPPGCKYKSSFFIQIQYTSVNMILEKMYKVILVKYS